jgi:hypothetical protein
MLIPDRQDASLLLFRYAVLCLLMSQRFQALYSMLDLGMRRRPSGSTVRLFRAPTTQR